MEARMEGLSLGEGSRHEDWENLFRKVPEAQAILLDSLDLESALTCRLVCQEWRETVSGYRKLRAKINEANIHRAAQAGHVLLTELLIAKGGKVNAQDHYWRTPLHVASANGHVEVVNLLLQAG